MSRHVPTFLVAGAAKSGTTSLAHYLRQHPDVFVAREKESHHFLFDGQSPQFTGPGDDREFNRLLIPDRSRYLACFDDVARQRAIGEASVYYMYRPEAMERALAFSPEMRFIVILREPLARAYSAYSHHRRDQWEPLADFAAAVVAEDERVASGWSFGWHYRRVSDYAAQLRAAKQIVPAKQLRVVLYDDLVDRPVETLQSLFEYLGVDDSFVCDTSLRLNVSGRPRSDRLNSLLARSGPAKNLVKRMVPYRLGINVQQRVRNWNLRPEQLDDRAEDRLREVFRFDAEEIGRLANCNVNGWARGERQAP